MNTILEIEQAMGEALMHPKYSKVRQEYNRLLGIMGNVDGDEVISLVIVAYLRVMSGQST